jgi:hypothetical protein
MEEIEMCISWKQPGDGTAPAADETYEHKLGEIVGADEAFPGVWVERLRGKMLKVALGSSCSGCALAGLGHVLCPKVHCHGQQRSDGHNIVYQSLADLESALHAAKQSNGRAAPPPPPIRCTPEQASMAGLAEALTRLLEVQVKPSTEYEEEWRTAVDHARRELRRARAVAESGS